MRVCRHGYHVLDSHVPLRIILQKQWSTFFRVYIVSSKHLMGCISVSNLKTLLVFIRGYVNIVKVLYCLNLKVHHVSVILAAASLIGHFITHILHRRLY